MHRLRLKATIYSSHKDERAPRPGPHGATDRVLAGVTPEEQQIVTGTVLIATLVVVRLAGNIGVWIASAQRAGAPTRQQHVRFVKAFEDGE